MIWTAHNYIWKIKYMVNGGFFGHGRHSNANFSSAIWCFADVAVKKDLEGQKRAAERATKKVAVTLYGEKWLSVADGLVTHNHPRGFKREIKSIYIYMKKKKHPLSVEKNIIILPRIKGQNRQDSAGMWSTKREQNTTSTVNSSWQQNVVHANEVHPIKSQTSGCGLSSLMHKKQTLEC